MSRNRAHLDTAVPIHAGVLLDGLRDWMRRKGFADLDEVRGPLAVPEDQVARERADYVGAVSEADSRLCGAW